MIYRSNVLIIIFFVGGFYVVNVRVLVFNLKGIGLVNNEVIMKFYVRYLWVKVEEYFSGNIYEYIVVVYELILSNSILFLYFCSELKILWVCMI